MPADVARDLTTTRGLSDVGRLGQVELFAERRQVVGVGVHVIALETLGRPSVTPAIVRDRAIAVRREEEQLCVPRVGIEWPAVAEDDRLTRPPIFVKDLRPVVGCDPW